MKKSTSLIIASSIVLIASIFIYYSERSQDEYDLEKKWYAENLNYNFCATIESVNILNQKWGYGYVKCVSKQNISYKIEDSLNLKLKYNNSLRFAKVISESRLELLVEGILNIHIGDSICVSSKDHSVKIYRNGVMFANQRIDKNLRDKWFN